MVVSRKREELGMGREVSVCLTILICMTTYLHLYIHKGKVRIYVIDLSIAKQKRKVLECAHLQVSMHSSFVHISHLVCDVT